MRKSTGIQVQGRRQLQPNTLVKVAVVGKLSEGRNFEEESKEALEEDDRF